MGMKFENRTWENTSKFRKRWFVWLWIFLFWPVAWISAVSGRIYCKDPAAKNGVNRTSLFFNFFIVVILPIMAVAVLVLVTQTAQYSQYAEPSSAQANSATSNNVQTAAAHVNSNSAHKRFCRNATPSIIRVINNISLLQTEHVKVIDHNKAKFASYDSGSNTTHCTIGVTLSNTSNMTFDVKIFPAPYHKNRMMIEAQAANTAD